MEANMCKSGEDTDTAVEGWKEPLQHSPTWGQAKDKAGGDGQGWDGLPLSWMELQNVTDMADIYV